MTKREFIKKQIENNNRKIQQLSERVDELYREDLLLCDDVQWFEEKIESHPKEKWQRKPNLLDGKLVGRIYWNEEVPDDSTGEIATFKRSKIVRINGEWIY